MSELKDRIEARRKQLEADLLVAKANATAAGKEAATKIKGHLAELETSLKGGWDNISDEVQERLNKWLKRDKDQDQS